MIAMLPTFETFVPPGPAGGAARRLALVHPEQSGFAWTAHASSADLAARAPQTFLSGAELAQAASFRFAGRRETFLLGRWAAKAALGAYLAEPDWTRIELKRGVFGQPLVNHAANSGAEVSLSHSGGLAVALAFPREQPLAVDVETVDESRAATVRSELKLLPEESEWVRSAAVAERAACVLLWTVREALGKALRCGLACPLELLAVDEIKPLAAGLWASRYRNFSQYRCLSWVRANLVVSVTLPKLTELRTEAVSTASEVGGGK